MPKGTQIFVGEPAHIPDGLLEHLARHFAADGRVDAAYRAQVYIHREGERPHLTVGLVPRAAADERAVLDAVAAALAGWGAPPMDFVVIHPKDPGAVQKYMLDSTAPFFRRHKH